jgi:hypothetical protein
MHRVQPEGKFSQPSGSLQPRPDTLKPVSWSRLLPVLLAATVSMTMAEFMEVQKLSPDALRARFGLPPACDPS